MKRGIQLTAAGARGYGSAVSIIFMVLLGACGGSPAGPSAVEVPQAVQVATQTARVMPSDLDPAYVLAISTGESGRQLRWEGGPFRHCFNVDGPQLEMAQATAARMTALSGIPRAEAGACNVEWVMDHEVGHTYANLHASEVGIIFATVHLHNNDRLANVLHEGGHVLGLGHSPRRFDLMNANTPPDGDYTPDEIAVLAWMYAR